MYTLKPMKESKKNNLISDLRPVDRKSSNLKSFINHSSMYKRIFIILGLILVFVVLWSHFGNKKTTEQLELNQIKTLVGTHMLLPVDEEPTLVTVVDKTKVKDEFIAKKSQNNDQILIYTKNKMAIIYRPSINKIVAIGNIFADQSLVEADGVTITVLDGANDSSKTSAIIRQLEALYPKADITDGGKTNRQDFTTTIVIDNSQKKDNLTDAIAQEINGKRGIVPISESITVTDLMIIVGKD